MNERCGIGFRAGQPGSIWRDQSGKSSIRGIFALFLIAALVYFSMKFIPVRAAAYQFDDAIRDEVVYAGSRRTTDEQIMKDLLEKAVILGLPITRENITIVRSGRKYIIIDADYTVKIELIGGYEYDPQRGAESGSLMIDLPEVEAALARS